MNKSNFLIFVILGIFSIFIVAILTIFSFDEKEDNYSKLNIVTSYELYYAAVTNTNYFIDALKEENPMKVYSLLNLDYKRNENIKKNNIKNKIEKMNLDARFVGDKIYYKVNEDNIYIYLVSGKIINKNNNEIIKDEYKIGLLIDYQSLLISFYPLEKDKDIDYIVDTKIKVNKYNTIVPSKALNNENMCKLYYEQFIKLVNNNPRELYNLTTEDIKNKYNEEEFIYTINRIYKNYKFNYKNCKVTEDKVKQTRVFNLVDKSNKKIYFYENGVMNYNINLDIN